jgi:ketosteroid isomerase-like protein
MLPQPGRRRQRGDPPLWMAELDVRLSLRRRGDYHAAAGGAEPAGNPLWLFFPALGAIMTQQELIDQLAIQQLISRYAISVDNRDLAAYASCFTEDVVISGPGFEMRGEVAKPTIDLLSSTYEATMHNVHNYAYTVTGERASGVAHCVASHIKNEAGAKSKFDMYIRYHDELVKRGGQWFFSARRLEVVCTTTVAL